jgi:hypothetical protein
VLIHNPQERRYAPDAVSGENPADSSLVEWSRERSAAQKDARQPDAKRDQVQ